MVVDATTGQNAIDQAKTFMKFVPLTGLVLTKLDGTAKGGIALSIQKELRLPIKFITIGEAIEDIEPFGGRVRCFFIRWLKITGLYENSVVENLGRP